MSNRPRVKDLVAALRPLVSDPAITAILNDYESRDVTYREAVANRSVRVAIKKSQKQAQEAVRLKQQSLKTQWKQITGLPYSEDLVTASTLFTDEEAKRKYIKEQELKRSMARLTKD